MRILVCYASTEGQTRKIARFCADRLFGAGHSVELLNATDTEGLEVGSFDAAILAGSVHVGRVQAGLKEFSAANANALNGMSTLFLQVSLAAAGDDAEERGDLDRIAHAFCDEAGWTPGAIHQVAGAFRFTEYDFFRSWAMRYIARQKGQQVDPRKDREYTDWDALARILEDWAGAA